MEGCIVCVDNIIICRHEKLTEGHVMGIEILLLFFNADLLAIVAVKMVLQHIDLGFENVYLTEHVVVHAKLLKTCVKRIL